MKYRIFEAFIYFKKSVIQIEEFGGISHDIVFFNPSRNDKGELDYKIQLTERLFLKEKGKQKLININEIEEDFIIVNSDGEEIIDSNDTKPEFIDLMLEYMEVQSDNNYKYN